MQDTPNSASQEDQTNHPRADLGAMLTQIREQCGYSIERAAVATRISPPFIEALENGELDKLPGSVFGRGFIRNLCKVYQQDPKPMLAAFEAALNEDRPLRFAYDGQASSKKDKFFPKLQVSSPLFLKKRIREITRLIQNYRLAMGLVSLSALVSLWIAYELFQGPSEAPKVSKVEQLAPPRSAPATEIKQEPAQVIEAPQVVTGNWVELRFAQVTKFSFRTDTTDWQLVESQSERLEFDELLELQLPRSEGIDISFNGKRLFGENEKLLSKKLIFRKDAIK